MIQLLPELNQAPEHIRHIHIMGICGTGMAALAGMLQRSGYVVTGSDNHVYPPMSDFLNELNIPICNGYAEINLSPRPDLVIVGNVITRKNLEAIALSKTTIPYLSFPQALSHFFIKTRDSLVITGTHGKTTTCSLLATALYRAKLDPTFMIGGLLSEFGTNFRLGNGKYFVAEGDEYDTAFFDKESKFLHYRPYIGVITSIEFDHADIFSSISEIKSAFKKFVSLLPENGLLIANLDDNNVREVIGDARCKIEGYGLDPSYYWSLQNIHTESGSSTYDILKEGSLWSRMEVRMWGKHNCLNSLAVCAILNRLGIAPTDMKQGLSTFRGVKRRQEIRGIVNEITVIDDFAHHPTAVKETLAALKQGYPGKRLVVVFEPRTNSSRRSIFQQDYVGAFGNAHAVLVREPIPIDGLNREELFSSVKLAETLRIEKKITAESFQTTDEILIRLDELLHEGDVVAILSNGGFDNIHERLLEQLTSR